MKFLVLLAVFLSVVFAEETIEMKEEDENEATVEVDHSVEDEEVLEFQSPDVFTEQQLGWIDIKYF